MNDAALDIASLLAEYDRDRTSSSAVRAVRNLRRRLESASAADWASCAKAFAQCKDYETALTLLRLGLERSPAPELRLQLGDTLRQASDPAAAETVLRALLVDAPGDQATESLAQALRDQGKLSAATEMIAQLVEHSAADLKTRLRWIQFISSSQRPALAERLCTLELARGQKDAELYEIAGRLAASLGRFDEARSRYLSALDAGVDDNESMLLYALSGTQRYKDPQHPDILRLLARLRDSSGSPYVRASWLFALGKARDDLQDFREAAKALRDANALMRGLLSWSAADWDAQVAERLAALPLPRVGTGDPALVPVFVVGLPRSGTTLLADRLGRHPQVCNRGELDLLRYLDKWVSGSRNPRDPGLLAHVARFAEAHLRQDDTPARWYIDKNPFNFRYLGLVSALLPQSRIIYCRRNLRDTALSIWMHMFARGDDNGYAYRLEDIAALAAGCARLMEHWQRTLRLPFHVVEYEEFIAQPEAGLRRLSEFLELPDHDLLAAPPVDDQAILTASAWQARQPIYASARGRWTHYAPFVPELSALFPDASSTGG